MKPITSVMERSWSVRGRILAVREAVEELYDAARPLRTDQAAAAVSPGFNDPQSLIGGAHHETQLRHLASQLGVLDVDPLLCHLNRAETRVNCAHKRKRGPEQGRVLKLISIITL
jgi:hypothetical protein